MNHEKVAFQTSINQDFSFLPILSDLSCLSRSKIILFQRPPRKCYSLLDRSQSASLFPPDPIPLFLQTLMPGKFYKLLIAALYLLALCSAANAQEAAGVKKQSTTTQILNLTGNASGVKKQSTTTQILNLTGNASGVKKQSTTTQVLNMTGKVVVIVVGQTAKAAWKTTKFTAVEVGKPAARAIFLKAAPKATSFLFKLTGKAIQKGFPIGQKLFVTYVKTRLSI
jgi:hypothetical protein